MDNIKIENFHRCGLGDFPHYTSLPPEKSFDLRRRVAFLCNMQGEIDGLSLVALLDSMKHMVSELDESASSVNLSDILGIEGITPQHQVFINWYRFESIDAIAFNDLSDYFFDIWYPSSDDIDIFDDSAKWILSVDHHGKIFLIK